MYHIWQQQKCFFLLLIGNQCLTLFTVNVLYLAATNLALTLVDRKSMFKIVFCKKPGTYSELSNKRGVFLILFEKNFPTPSFFTDINGNNVPTPLYLESSE